MIASFQDYYRFLLLVFYAITISLPFRFVVLHFLFQKNKSLKNIIPVLSWIKNSDEIRWINLFFDFIFPALTFVHIWHSENLLILSLKLVLIATLISLGLIDWFIYRLPNLLLIVGLIITVLLLVVNSAIYLNHVYGAIIGFGIGFGIRILGKMYYKKEVFGVGDVKLLGFLGLLAGWNFFFPVFFMGMLIASIYSVIAILFKKLDWKSKIPLGSFFCIALIIFQIIDQKCLDFIYQIN